MPSSSRQPAAPTAIAPALPVLVFDGDCAFCRAAADRARRLSAGRVRAVPLRTAASELPDLDLEAAARAVQLVEPDGHVHAGAAAVVRLLAIAHPCLRPLLALYRLPGLQAIADKSYAFVAARRHRLGGSTGACAEGACGHRHPPAPRAPAGET